MKTRIFTHPIGVLTLLYAYRFFSGYFPKSFNLLFIGLVAINPVFSFSTYVTVLDSIVFLFMFISLRQISVYLYGKDIPSLLWAGVWFGLGNAVKYPLFLWLAPIGFLFLYYERKQCCVFHQELLHLPLHAVCHVRDGTCLFERLIFSPGSGLSLHSLSTLLLVGDLVLPQEKRRNPFKDISRLICGNKKIFLVWHWVCRSFRNPRPPVVWFIRFCG